METFKSHYLISFIIALALYCSYAQAQQTFMPTNKNTRDIIIFPRDSVAGQDTAIGGIDTNATTTDFKDISAYRIAVYPNPTVDVVHIESSSVMRATVYNLKGQILIQTNSDKPLSLGCLRKGIYLLILEDIKGRQYSEKIILCG